MLIEAITIFQLGAGAVSNTFPHRRDSYLSPPINVAYVSAPGFIESSQFYPSSTQFSEAVAPEEIRVVKPTDVAESPSFNRLGGRLMALYNIDGNWDGEAAVKPISRSIDDAIAFTTALPPDVPLPKEMIMPTGETALYWDLGEKYAEIGFDGDGGFYAYACHPDMPSVHIDDEKVFQQDGGIQFPAEVYKILIS